MKTLRNLILCEIYVIDRTITPIRFGGTRRQRSPPTPGLEEFYCRRVAGVPRLREEPLPQPACAAPVPPVDVPLRPVPALRLAVFVLAYGYPGNLRRLLLRGWPWMAVASPVRRSKWWIYEFQMNAFTNVSAMFRKCRILWITV